MPELPSDELVLQDTTDIYTLGEEERWDVLQELVQENAFRARVAASRLMFMQQGDTRPIRSLAEGFTLSAQERSTLGIGLTNDPHAMEVTEPLPTFDVAGRPIPFTSVRNEHGQFGFVIGHKMEDTWELTRGGSVRGMAISLTNQHEFLVEDGEGLHVESRPAAYKGIDVDSVEVITLDAGDGMGLYNSDRSPDHSLFLEKLYLGMKTNGSRFATPENPSGKKLLVVADAEYNILHIFDTLQYEQARRARRHVSQSEQSTQTLRGAITHTADRVIAANIYDIGTTTPGVDPETVHFAIPQIETLVDAAIGTNITALTDERGGNPTARDEVVERLAILDAVMRATGTQAGRALVEAASWMDGQIRASDPRYTALVFPGESAQPFYKIFREWYKDGPYRLVSIKNLPNSPEEEHAIQEQFRTLGLYSVVTIDMGEGHDRLASVVGRKINRSLTVLQPNNRQGNTSIEGSFHPDLRLPLYLKGVSMYALNRTEYMLSGLHGAIDMPMLQRILHNQRGKLPPGAVHQFVGLLAFREGIEEGINRSLHPPDGTHTEALRALNTFGEQMNSIEELVDVVVGQGFMEKATRLITQELAA